MDTGVGSFVFSQGVVSAIPLLRDPAYLTGSLRRKVISVSWKNLPVLVLGLVRVLLVKGTDYPVSSVTSPAMAADAARRNTHLSTGRTGIFSLRWP